VLHQNIAHEAIPTVLVMATYLYHEKQDSALCAVHSLNNLLQGQFFSAIELMDIALKLDREEKALMAELGNDTKDYLKYMSVRYCINGVQFASHSDRKNPATLQRMAILVLRYVSFSLFIYLIRSLRRSSRRRLKCST
jgi:hypothetical protein